MIFKPVLVDKILKRHKTMTRRPVRAYTPPTSPWVVTKTGTRRRRPIPRTVELDGRQVLAPYRVGKILPVQKGRGKTAVAHVEILELRTERAGQITLADARAEGFRTTSDFKAYWTRLYTPGASDLDDEDVLVDIFESEHADTSVWVIAFQLGEPPERYLRRTSGYTPVAGESLTARDDVPGYVFAADLDGPDGDDRYRASPPPHSLRPAPVKLPSDAEREAMRSRLRTTYNGWEPEDIVADDPRYGTPGDVRSLRREMGLRGTDGLQPIPEDELERVLAFMLFREASLREIALAMDWSLGKTQRELAKRGRSVDVPHWMTNKGEAA